MRINWVRNQHKRSGKISHRIDHFSEKEMEKTYHFHKSLPGYTPTPLHSLTGLSDSLGAGAIYVKDESKRFGLRAFKGLGASYAMASYFAEKLSLDLHSMDFSDLMEQVRGVPPETFATVTAGNHGKGVAWAAGLFGQEAKVYLPKGSSVSRQQAIQELGAEASISDLNYDDTVNHIACLAKEKGWVLMQDTAWEGYETIPLFIMQGYTTIVSEIADQLKELALHRVTHIILQAGVGSFAASIAAALHHFRPDSYPKLIIVEPDKADCLYHSALHKEGEPQQVDGDLSTMMAGLACGEPNPIGWDLLRTVSDYFFSCNDAVSANGMRIFANPTDGDERIVSGESGAVPLGLLHELYSNEGLQDIKEELKLDQSSNILIINTEGDTDPDNYKRIIETV